MRHIITVLWIQALNGSRKAYRRLGMMYAKSSRIERILAKACLEKSMELGDEYGLYIYYRYFGKGRQVIDDLSYGAMVSEYMQVSNPGNRRKLRRYLEMGTKRQKALFWLDCDMPDSGDTKIKL